MVLRPQPPCAALLVAVTTISVTANVVVAPSGALLRKEEGERKVALPTKSWSRHPHRHHKTSTTMDRRGKEALDEICPPASGPVETLPELESQRCNIFRTGISNAAAFRMAAFLLGRATPTGPLSRKEFGQLNKGYCPISGDPISGRNNARVTLKNAIGDDFTIGRFYYCDAPDICDAKDLLKVDTKNVSLLDGNWTFRVLVIGDPCQRQDGLNESFVDLSTGKPSTLRKAAPEVQCDDNNRLKGAVMSDGGLPIFGLFYMDDNMTDADGIPTYDADPLPPTEDGDTDEWHEECAQRAREGYQTGKGNIFRKLAEVVPVFPPPEDEDKYKEKTKSQQVEDIDKDID